MSLATEGNTNLAFNTEVFRKCANEYAGIAKELRRLATKLDNCLAELESNGWTTPAGTAFHKMVKSNWQENVEKYADLLDTLRNILIQSATEYDDLVTNYIETTKL